MSDEEIEDKDKRSILSNPQKGKPKEDLIADMEKGYHLGDILYTEREEIYDRWKYKNTQKGKVK